MKISHKESSVISRYIDKNKHLTLDDYASTFTNILEDIKTFKEIDSNTKLLEIGSGIGWFQLLCKRNKIHCKGIEISPQLVNYSYSFGQKYGLTPDIELGNIEDADIGVDKYDIVIASSVFEHVEYWQKGIRNVYNALKKGGLFYFVSTNKFSIIKSGECGFPLYGLLPARLRRYLLIRREGKDIVQLGLDFNQFDYFQLKKFFNNVGFSSIYDFVEFIEPKNIDAPWMKVALRYLRFKPLRLLGLLFAPITFFICIK